MRIDLQEPDVESSTVISLERSRKIMFANEIREKLLEIDVF